MTSSYLTWEGEIGSIVFTNLLGNDFVHHDAPYDLAYGLVSIFVLGLCLISWVFSCASKVFLTVLIIGSSRHLRLSHVLHPIELQNKHL